MANADEKISNIRDDTSISHCTRRITKIISDWQTDANQTALDVEIEEGMAHGSWISKEEKNQDALVPEKHHRKEMETPMSPKRTEQGVNFGLLFGKGVRRWVMTGGWQKSIRGSA
jgi:hypothetical protein